MSVQHCTARAGQLITRTAPGMPDQCLSMLLRVTAAAGFFAVQAPEDPELEVGVHGDRHNCHKDVDRRLLHMNIQFQ